MSVRADIQEEWVNAIKNCGQSLIDNADEIAGNYDFQTGVVITIQLRPGEFVEIEVATTYIPKDVLHKEKVCFLPLHNNYSFTGNQSVENSGGSGTIKET